MKQYQEIKEISNRLEAIRIELYTDEEHKKNCAAKDFFQEVDDSLLRIQSELRDLRNLLEVD